MKKKLLALFLILAMVLTLAPTMALAEEGEDGGNDKVECTHSADCKAADGDHDPTCPKHPDYNAPVTCTKDGDCKAADGDHDPTCPKHPNYKPPVTCTKDADCKAADGDHNPACPKHPNYKPPVTCTKDANCKAADGDHDPACPKHPDYKAPVTCTGKADCKATSHNKDCVSQCTKDSSCKNTEGNADVHKSGCPKATKVTEAKTITKVEISKPSSVTVGGTVSFTVASVNGDASLKSAVSVGTVTWKKSDGTANNSGSATKAPSTAGTYSVEITVTAATGYTLGSDVSPVKLTGIEVKAATNSVNPSSVSYNPSTGLLTWVMPSTVTADNAVSSGNSDFKVDIQNSDGKSALSKTISLVYKGTSSAYTVSMKDSTFTATVPQPSSLTAKSQYTLVIWNANLSSDTVTTTFTAVDTSTAVPSASSVTSPEAAAEALQTVQKMDAAKLAVNLENALSSGVSSSFSITKPSSTELEAAKKVLDDLAALDKAIQKQASIKVDVVSSANVPSALSVSSISIDNAALNAKEAKNSTVELEIYAPHSSHTLPDTYNKDTAVAFGMSMANVVSSSNLAVPVVITMPVPSGLDASKVAVLHYHGNDTFKTIYPSISGSKISFVVTGFSDFVLAEIAGEDKNTAPAPIFTDVPADHSFAAQIAWARDNGVMGGYADGSFRPGSNTTRQALWMVLGRLAGAAPADMAAARTWAMNYGVSDGTNPEGAMSRQQMITMLYRFAQKQGKSTSGAADLSGYADNGAVASYAKDALAWGVGNGIITGTNDGKLNPGGNATRAHFAAFLYRFSTQT